MQPTTEILARISKNSLANKEEIFTKLYRYLLRPDLYFTAYNHLYANNGAATKGANNDTADGFPYVAVSSRNSTFVIYISIETPFSIPLYRFLS